MVACKMVGQHVTTLVDARQAGGEYRVTWDASGVSSGVYLLRLRSQEHIETRQMVLLR